MSTFLWAFVLTIVVLVLIGVAAAALKSWLGKP
jgi:hypothetical protein